MHEDAPRWKKGASRKELILCRRLHFCAVKIQVLHCTTELHLHTPPIPEPFLYIQKGAQFGSIFFLKKEKANLKPICAHFIPRDRNMLTFWPREQCCRRGSFSPTYGTIHYANNNFGSLPTTMTKITPSTVPQEAGVPTARHVWNPDPSDTMRLSPTHGHDKGASVPPMHGFSAGNSGGSENFV